MSIEQDCRETVVFSLMKAKAWTKPQAEEYVSLWLEHSTAIQQAEAKTDEPVLTVEKEPDYWSGGHFHKGYRPHIDPTKVWDLPIGTKLYTHPAPGVPEGWIKDLFLTVHAMEMNNWHWKSSASNALKREAHAAATRLYTAAQAQKGQP